MVSPGDVRQVVTSSADPAVIQKIHGAGFSRLVRKPWTTSGTENRGRFDSADPTRESGSALRAARRISRPKMPTTTPPASPSHVITSSGNLLTTVNAATMMRVSESSGAIAIVTPARRPRRSVAAIARMVRGPGAIPDARPMLNPVRTASTAGFCQAAVPTEVTFTRTSLPIRGG